MDTSILVHVVLDIDLDNYSPVSNNSCQDRVDGQRQLIPNPGPAGGTAHTHTSQETLRADSSACTRIFRHSRGVKIRSVSKESAVEDLVEIVCAITRTSYRKPQNWSLYVCNACVYVMRAYVCANDQIEVVVCWSEHKNNVPAEEHVGHCGVGNPMHD